MDDREKKLKVGALLTHPVQYYSPWFVELAKSCDLKVYYAFQQTPQGQAEAGFSTAFEWDIPLLEGYEWQFLNNVSRKPGLHSFGGCDSPEIYRILQKEQFDALLMFGWNKKCYLQGWYAALRSGTSVFIRLDSQLGSQQKSILSPLRRLAYSCVLPYAADYLSPGKRTDEYLRYYRVSEKRIHRLPHMIDTERFERESTRARDDGTVQAIRSSNGASEQTFVFLFVGKLIEKKRPELAIRALEKLMSKQVQLWIVGDGPLRQELQTIVDQSNLPVQFLGFINQSQLPGIYAAADCLVLSSDATETWGLVVNEAFASATPAIVSIEAGCAPELIDEEQTGWILAMPAVDTLAQILSKVVDQARKLPRQEMVRKSEQGSFERGVNQFLDIVETKSGGVVNAKQGI
ncbi:glycosyltransferase family 4 protein [Pseudomonadota bacterium]